MRQERARRGAAVYLARRGQAVPARGVRKASGELYGFLFGARRREEVQGGGVQQVRAWRHQLVHRARRREAVHARELRQVCARQHGGVQGSRGREAVPDRGVRQDGGGGLEPVQGPRRGEAVRAPGVYGASSGRHGLLQAAPGREAMRRGVLPTAGPGSQLHLHRPLPRPEVPDRRVLPRRARLLRQLHRPRGRQALPGGGLR
mmetsp:Transcript_3808/g.7431  ORF Transcript_3808/g.7431 Transcript_3808/m.7431 type:complete len:203 (-) Transcript_3808:281-889(-)